FIAGEIIAAGAGMAIDDAKRGRLVLQMNENTHQHDVLDDVGEVAGMEAVTVVHGKVGGPLRNTATFYASWPGLSRLVPADHGSAGSGERKNPALAAPKLAAPHRWHRHLVAPAATAIDFLACAELQILAEADAHFAEPR